MSETPQHASYCGNASGPDPLCGGCGMSETPQSVLERYIRDGGIITLPHIREAVRAMLDLVRVQYAANEEMTRVLSSAEAERVRAEKFWASAQERAEKMEAERDEARSDWVALVDEAASTEAERDALRAEVGRYKNALTDAVGNKAHLQAEVERLTDLCQRNSDDLAFLDDARALYTETERKLSATDSRMRQAEAALRGMVERYARHSGLCVPVIDGKMGKVTLESCVCDPLHKQARAALCDTAPAEQCEGCGGTGEIPQGLPCDGPIPCPDCATEPSRGGEAMSETPQTEWLECPCCGEGVMGRTSPALWYQDEEEVCDCGCVVAASVDEHEDPPQAYAVVRKGCPEHGEVE